MAIGDVIARLAVSLTLETAAFEKGANVAEKRLAQSEKKFKALGDKMQGLGKTLSLSVTAPIVAFGVASVRAANESNDALAQVTASLKSMGDGAGRTVSQLQGLATGIMKKSLYDDDEILRKVTANLLTFGSVQGKVFDQAQQVIVDYSAKTGKDLQSSTIMVGKALQDPIKGLAALGKAGVQFTAEQKALIKGFVETGQAAKAQQIILDEFTRQTKGSAEAARKANPGAALKQSFDELLETVGAKLLPLMPGLTDALTKVVDLFGSLSPGMQTAVVVGAALAAALGPVITILGGLVSLAAPVLAGFSGIAASIAAIEGLTFVGTMGAWSAALGSLLGSFLAIAAPVAAFAAAGYLIYKNWDDIAPRLTPIIGNLRDLAEWLGIIGPKAKEAGDKSKQATSDMEDLGQAASNASAKFQTWADDFDAYNARTAKSARDNHTTIQDGLKQLWEGFSNFTANLNSWGASVGASFSTALGYVIKFYQGVKTWISDKLGQVFDSVKAKVEEVKGYFFNLYDAVVGHSYIPDMVDGIAKHMARLDGVLVKPIKKATERAAADFQRLRNLMDELFPESAALLEFQSNRDFIEGRKDLSDAEKYEAIRRLGLKLTGFTGPVDVANDNDDLGLDPSKMDDAARKTLEAYDLLKKGAGTTKVEVVKSFKEMADQTIQSLQTLTSAIKGGGFLDIFSAVVGLALQLGGIGAFGKGFQAKVNAIPRNATGTGHHYGGLTLVGERGPEVANLPSGTKIYPNGKGPGQGGGIAQIVPSKYFDVVVDGRVLRAAPAIMDGGARIASTRQAYRQTRRVG
jgi:hypothetical protein